MDKQLEKEFEKDMKELEHKMLEEYAKKREEYNGWANYETWLISLYFTDIIYEYFEECEDALLSKAYEYADNIRDMIAEMISQDLPTSNKCFVHSMCDSFMNRVDWNELCEIHLEDVLEDRYEEKIKQSTTN